jgi:protoheme IX farnesyltransferase
MTFRTEAIDISLTGTVRRGLDFLELTKPRIVLMILLTTTVGFYLGSPGDYGKLLATLIGTALAAGGTLALNQLLERDVDARMERTRRRPIPDKRIYPGEALVFGVSVTVAGLVFLSLMVNALSAWVTAVIVVTYLVVYTPLKRRSLMCVVVGAVPGALPPVIGWTAASGLLEVEAWVLFAILFLWQVPHTLAIARIYRDDFAKAGIRFLPVIEPDGRSTGRQVISYCLALIAVSLLPTLTGLTGAVYFVSALTLGGVFLSYGVGMALSQSVEAARKLLFASLAYLPLLLIVMALDSIRFLGR